MERTRVEEIHRSEVVCVNEEEHTALVFIEQGAARLVRNSAHDLKDGSTAQRKLLLPAAKGMGRLRRHGRHARHEGGKLLTCYNDQWKRIGTVSLRQYIRQRI